MNLPQLLRTHVERYYEAIAILTSLGISRDASDWGDRLYSQIRALSIDQDKAA